MTTPDSRRTGEAHTLPRDEALSRLYRGQADRDGAGPPAALDARVLAAAREALATPRRPARAPLAWWRRLMVPVSLAAVLLVSATLTLMVHDEQTKLEEPVPAAPPASAPRALEEAPSAAASATPPARAPVLRQESAHGDRSGSAPALGDVPATSGALNQTPAAIAPGPKARAAKRADESARELRRFEGVPAAGKAPAKPAPAGPAVPQPTPDAFPAQAPALPARPATEPASRPATGAAKGTAEPGAAEVPSAAVGRTRAFAPPLGEDRSPVPVLREAPQSPESAAPSAATPRPSGLANEPAMRSRDTAEPESGQKPRLEQKAARSPEAWLDEIRALKRAGREAQWREALQSFRARYPDYPLPEDLR